MKIHPYVTVESWLGLFSKLKDWNIILPTWTAFIINI